MDPSLFVASIVVLIISVIVHEVAHGYAAEMLGDPTARLAGRLTLNPIKHIDPVGSILVPGILILSGVRFLIGWAKPVPYNPYNFQRGGKWGEAFVAFAGPGVNILLALIFGILIRFLLPAGMLSQPLLEIFSVVVYINLLLALFNLIPIPPLDGSKVITPFLPYRAAQTYRGIEAWAGATGFIGLFLFIYLFMTFISPVFGSFLSWLFALITGIGII